MPLINNFSDSLYMIPQERDSSVNPQRVRPKVQLNSPGVCAVMQQTVLFYILHYEIACSQQPSNWYYNKIRHKGHTTSTCCTTYEVAAERKF
jgi:hypothetical protein